MILGSTVLYYYVILYYIVLYYCTILLYYTTVLQALSLQIVNSRISTTNSLALSGKAAEFSAKNGSLFYTFFYQSDISDSLRNRQTECIMRVSPRNLTQPVWCKITRSAENMPSINTVVVLVTFPLS